MRPFWRQFAINLETLNFLVNCSCPLWNDNDDTRWSGPLLTYVINSALVVGGTSCIKCSTKFPYQPKHEFCQLSLLYKVGHTLYMDQKKGFPLLDTRTSQKTHFFLLTLQRRNPPFNSVCRLVCTYSTCPFKVKRYVGAYSIQFWLYSK